MSCFLCDPHNPFKSLSLYPCKKCDINFSKLRPCGVTEYGWLELLECSTSITAETEENFQEWIAQPVLKYNFAPRQARAILEIFGKLANDGANLSVIMKKIIDERVLAKSGIKGNEAGKNLIQRTSMITTEILFFGQKCIISCDGDCTNAWGLNWHKEKDLSAPSDPGTYEGGHAKPLNKEHNKWCARECERASLDKS